MGVRCIRRIRDKQGRITGYILQNEDGRQASVDAAKMKQLLSTGTVVENLKLTSDNRIIYMETATVVPKTANPSRVLIDSDVLDELVRNNDTVSVTATQKRDNNNVPEIFIHKASGSGRKDLTRVPLAELLDIMGIARTVFNGENSILEGADSSAVSLRDFMIMADKYSKSNKSTNSGVNTSKFEEELGLNINTSNKKVYLEKSTLEALEKKIEGIYNNAFTSKPKPFKLSFKSNITSDIVVRAKSNKTLFGTYQNGELFCIKVGNNFVLASPHIIALPKDARYMFKLDMNRWTRSQFSVIDVSKLDTSEVVNMHATFATYVDVINLDLIDTSNVTDMSYLFTYDDYFEYNNDSYKGSEISMGDIPPCGVLHIDLSTSIDTHNVRKMIGMFAGVYIEGTYVCTLDTSNVEDMTGMFANAGYPSWYEGYDFDNHRTTVLDLSHLDTHNVKNMNWMFAFVDLDKLVLGDMDTSNVKNMSWMFENAILVEDKVLDLSSFDTRNVTEYRDMFKNCKVSIIKIGKNWTLPDSVFEGCNAKIVRC